MKITDYERRTFSQEGEDGITLELVHRLAPPAFFVEIGAGDGNQCCGRILAENHWRGIMIDARVPEFTKMRQNLVRLTQVIPMAAFVTCENAHGIFSGMKRDFGVLIIDIDGNDYHLWKTLCSGPDALRPWVVIIEVNEKKKGPYVMPYQADYAWNGHSVEHGASLESMTALGRELGYECLGTTTQGVNAFFVRADLAPRLHD